MSRAGERSNWWWVPPVEEGRHRRSIGKWTGEIAVAGLPPAGRPAHDEMNFILNLEAADGRVC